MLEHSWGKALHYTDAGELALLTDLYELTMAASFFDHRMFQPATFSLFIREYPLNRGYFVSAGLHEVVRYLSNLRFTEDDLRYLKSTGIFKDDFLAFLRGLRFTGELRAIPEGRLFFLNEPVVEVTAPLIEAQIVETFVINAISVETLLATKASRSFYAARGRPCVDFSFRRTQGYDAGMKVARDSYIAGFSSTSNVLAAKAYGIPASGTMAHSYIESFEQESDAFRSFVESFPHGTTLLIDTYDTLQGARKAAEVAREMERRGHRLGAVRLDSGDIGSLAKGVRRILDQVGLEFVRIFASGAMDEYKIDRLLSEGAPIDAFGVGTKMGVSADAPWLDIAYKLVKYDGRPVMKLSTGKVTLVEEKEVFRLRDGSGKFTGDVIAVRGEEPPELKAEPLLETLMVSGRPATPPPTLQQAREAFLRDFAALDPAHKALYEPTPYLVALSTGLREVQEKVTQEIRRKELGE
jgi:nicotinate phosphoribosyltransferase